jgi:hypothetical protein
MPQMCRQEPERPMLWVNCLTTLLNTFFNPSLGLQLNRLFKEHSKGTHPGRSIMAKATKSRSNGVVTLV